MDKTWRFVPHSKSEEKRPSLVSSLVSNLSARWRRCDAANRPADARPGRPRATDARHSRHARSRNHHGHRAATVTPQSPQAAGKLPCATILSSLDAAGVDDGGVERLFCVPFGGRANARLYTSDSLCDDGGPGAAEYADCIYGSDCADCGPRMPVAAPMATCTKDCVGIPSYASDGDCDGGGPGAEYLGCQLGTDCATACADCGPRFPPPPPICAETCNWASDADCNDCSPGSEFRPAPGRRHVDQTIVTCGIKKVRTTVSSLYS